MTTADQRLSPPRQARSRDTLERFAGAAVTLLASESWDRIAVARLAREARSSVGAFYARFADKDALLDHLDERYARELTSLLQRRRRRLERLRLERRRVLLWLRIRRVLLLLAIR